MSAGDQDLFGTKLKVENKDVFVDLKKNGNGVYLKLSERNGKVKNTILIPASGIIRLKNILEEVAVVSAAHTRISPERKTRSVDNPDVLVRSVYVSGLAWTTTKEALAAHFNQIGPVEKATILYRSRRGKTVSLGCGVVEFCTPELAARAVSHMGTSELEGRSIRCREDRSVDSSSGDTTAGSGGARASPDAAIASPLIGGGKGAHQEPSARVLDPKRVFITSLAFDATQADLLELVSPLGVVVSAEIQYTRKGRSLGHAVVEFAEPAAAQLAVGTLDGRVVHGRTIIVRPYYKD